jgi:hypothetical protein
MYVWTQLSLDMIFPLAYGWLLIALARRVQSGCGSIFMPITACCAPLFDIVENLLSVLLVCYRQPSWLVFLASACTLFKSGCIAITLGAALHYSGWLVRLYFARIPLFFLLFGMVILPLWGRAPLTLRNLAVLETPWETFWAFLILPPTANVLLTAFQLCWSHAFERLGFGKDQFVPLPVSAKAPWWAPSREKYWSIVLRGALLALVGLPCCYWLVDINGSLDFGYAVIGWGIGIIVALGARHAVELAVRRSWLRTVQGLVIRLITPRTEAGNLSEAPWQRLVNAVNRCWVTPVGYGDRKAHYRATGIVVAFVGLATLLYCFTGPTSGRAFPTFGYLLVLFAMLGAIGAGMSFFLDRHRIPTILGVVIVSLLANAVLPKDHCVETQAWCEKQNCDGEPEPACILTSFEQRGEWRKHFKRHELPVLTVVAAAGGGIQAAGWTTKVLAGLEETFPGFSDTIYLLSGASGGSVGIFHWMEAQACTAEETHDKLPQAPQCGDDASTWFARAHCAATESSLQAIAWGLTFPDTFTFWDKRDRAWALEKSWLNNISLYACPGAKQSSAKKLTRMSDWARGASEGRLPGVVFNATRVDSGDLLWLSNLVWKSVTCNPSESSNSANTRASELARPVETNDRNDSTTPMPMNVEMDNPFDLSVVSAARLSATFPFITPVARPKSDDDDKNFQHIADGGFADNLGVVAAAQYLHDLLDVPTEALTTEQEIKDHEYLSGLGIKKILFLRIEPFADVPVSKRGGQGPIYQWGAPLTTLVNARSRTQTLRADFDLERLMSNFKARLPREIEFHAITLKPPPKDPWLPSPPLSWQLDDESKRAFEADWCSTLATQRGKLIDVFGAARGATETRCAKPSSAAPPSE